MAIHGYAAHAANEALCPVEYELGPLGRHEIDVAITHCGVCHCDLHLIDDDWGVSRYPFVAGHEIVNTVMARGADVADLEIGQRVGVGWQCGSCMA